MPIILFLTPVLLGSLLLFLIQPMISKHMLPLFGGASGVWAVSILFFQTALLIGYLYSYAITRLRPKTQAIIQVAIITVSLLVVIYRLVAYGGILPTLNLMLSGSYSPVLQVISFLTLSIGLPYFLLSTTSILISKWHYAIYPKKSPYPLYGVSNFGSLIAIAMYPFLFEPTMSTQAQDRLWSSLFIVFSFLFTSCALVFFIKAKRSNGSRLRRKSSDFKKAGIQDMRALRKAMLWLFLAGSSSFILVSGTNFITLSVAPVPFLWLLPLGLYLISFTLSFQGHNFLSSKVYALLSIALIPFCSLLVLTLVPSLTITLILFGLFLFSSFMVCHMGIYALKPHPNQLDFFYLIIALGGALGSGIVAIIAPLIFPGLWETPISLFLTFLTSIGALNNYNSFSIGSLRHNISFNFNSGILRKLYMMAYLSVIITSVALTFLFYYQSFRNKQQGVVVLSNRNFYGVLRIRDYETPEGKLRYLLHGRITHGIQYINNANKKIPTSYYSVDSGLGLIFINYKRLYSPPIRIGVVGLGAGTIAAYGQKGDVVRFFEINPAVVELSKNYFTYIKDSPAKVEIVLGDGRIKLEEENVQKLPLYDLLVLDAFSDDAIPMHLLTNEAFTSYTKRLKPQGALLINTANSYLNLQPVIKKLARHNHFIFFIASQDNNDSNASAPSQWSILTKNKTLIKQPDLNKFIGNKNNIKDIPLWTDSYNNLLQVLR